MPGGKLVLVATPIGNLGDLSPRAADALRGADLWIVEDTRQSAKLQRLLELRIPMSLLNDHTPESRIRELARQIASGKQAVQLTDGGCPGISDPGSALADLCHELGAEVDAIPGPSAVTAALMLSGFFAQRFAFLGFLPRKPGAARKELERYRESPLTLVLFESALRTDKLLGVLFEALGDRRYALCREISKAHQQVFRARLPSSPVAGQVPRKGEVTIVVEGLRRGQLDSMEGEVH